MVNIVLFNKNLIKRMISFAKTICSAIFVGIIATSGVALVIYTFMMLEELIAWIF
jgi:hypothetical protein